MMLAIPVIALLGFGLTRDPREIPSPLPGRPAPPFTLEVLRPGDNGSALSLGDTVRLEDHRGQVVVLNFWASWCLACRDEHGALSRVATRYAGRGVRFYGVLYQDTPASARAWVMEMGGQSYPSLLDPRSRTAISFGLYGVPETFFIARDGRVAYKHVGPVTETLLSTRLDELLAEPAEPAEPGGTE
jgi:cytochrome c biogenesis protein CcmG/thiol:disulfide interchange protein DsbE